MAIEHLSPLAPVSFPEFGTSTSWLMCRNALCPNFGVHYDGPSPEECARSVSDARYWLDLKAKRVKCRHCNLSFQMLPNLPVRPLARYFLSLSLPFADCPNPKCANHGFNLFENCPPKDASGVRRYRWSAGRQAVCRACQGRFMVGEALHVTRAKTVRKSFGAIMEGVRMGVSVTKTTEAKGIAIGTYYAHLLRCGARIQDNHSWRNAQLLHPRFAACDKPLLVQTDALEVSLQRFGDGPRYKLMKLLVSVVVLQEQERRSFFVLAAHPFFLPESRCPERKELMKELLEDRERPHFARRWEGVEHLLQWVLGANAAKTMETSPDLGRKGFFMRSPHAELAHFLVVGKMLSRFRRVHFHMDGDRSLRTAALVAFAERIQSGGVEIALFQHDKKAGRRKVPLGRAPSKKERCRHLGRAWAAMEDRFAEKLNSKGRFPLRTDQQQDAEVRAQARARAFRSAFKGAYSTEGEWAWLEHPPDNRQYARPRTLWLTRTPGQTLEDGRSLLLHASLQSVDSAFNAMREQVRSLGRPDFRSQPGRGFRSRYFRVDVVLCELWPYLLMRNYAIRKKTKQLGIPARALRLMAPNGKEPDLVEVALSFQLGRAHAERMSGWAGRGFRRNRRQAERTGA